MWDFAYDGGSNVVDQYVRYLRRKIDRPFGVEQLETVRGAGTAFAATGPRSRRTWGVLMPLRMRLSLMFALATAMALAVAGLAFVAQLQVSVDASLDPGLRAQLTDVADDLGAGDPEPPGPGTLLQVADAGRAGAVVVRRRAPLC